jgi:hypothetical protein
MLITREIDGVKYARADEVARELRDLKRTKLENEELIAQLRQELQHLAKAAEEASQTVAAVAGYCTHLSTVEAKAKRGGD